MIGLIIGVICGVISCMIASSKGRNAVGWFFGGLLLGIIGLIIVACLSDLKEEQARRQVVDMEHRRIREQLRQEQLKVESLRRYSVARLDAHDQALGLDTRSQPQLLTTDEPAQNALPSDDPAQALAKLSDDANIQPVTETVPAQPVAADSQMWYYERGGSSIGPVFAREILYQLKTGAISGDTLVWCNTLPNWVQARQVSEFREAAL